jgi:hypothetical protein
MEKSFLSNESPVVMPSGSSQKSLGREVELEMGQASMRVKDPDNAREELQIAIENYEVQLIELLQSAEVCLELEENSDNQEELQMLEKQIIRTEKIINSKRKLLTLMESRLNRTSLSNAVHLPAESAKSKSVVVPSGLPKFRQGQYNEPVEFLEAFAKVMDAHEIPVEKYTKLLALCLDSVDGQWFQEWSREHDGVMTWKEISEAFIQHFQHPNAAILWQEKIRNLRMDNTGVQRYTDQFIRLASRLGWDLDGDVAIYQYKSGLATWILNALTAAEAAAISSSMKSPGVSKLGTMALKIKANHRETHTLRERSHGEVKCFNCNRIGHRQADCRSRFKSYEQKSESRVDNFQLKKEEPKLEKPEIKVHATHNLTCFICGLAGHIATTCSERKKKV